ncbi:MAG: GNAT family N-acetyltransferase [Verrucomicrobiales bacterium]|nr:GNAT family N-acetyltransferase [Verrucomicrobiales bacterium]
MDSLEFPEAAPDEAEALSELAARIWHRVYPVIITREQIDYMLDWMYDPARIRSDMNDTGITFLWMQLEDSRRGFLAFGPDPKESGIWLHKLYLDPDFHRRGIGSAALAEVEKRVRETGENRIFLRVNRANEPAIGAYRKAGYEICEERCSEIGNGYLMDDFIMVKTF